MKAISKAVALRYFKEVPAPFVIARGRGVIAEKITKFAQKEGIHLIKDPELADNLIEIPIGDFIPEDMYEVIAEIFTFIYELEKET